MKCSCGCGQNVNKINPNARYVRGHYMRGKHWSKPSPLKGKPGRKMTEEDRIKHSIRMKNYYSSPDGVRNREALSLRNKEYYATKGGTKIRKKISKSLKRYFLSSEARKKLSNRMKKFYDTPAGKEAMRHLSEIFSGKPMSAETKKKMSASVRRFWRNQPKSAKMKKLHELLRGQNSPLPNKPEKYLLNLVKPLGFKYVGDGKLWIDGKNPDFIHQTKKVIIELYGGYWHKDDVKTGKFNKRANMFRRYGYSVVLVWDNKLKENPEKIYNRVERVLSRCV